MTAREPSAVEVIAEALLESDGMTANSDGTPTHYIVEAENVEYLASIAVAALRTAGYVVATREEIRAWTPEQVAELIGGEVQRLAWWVKHPQVRATGPWHEVRS